MGFTFGARCGMPKVEEQVMPISENMLARGAAVGLAPDDGESSGGFGNRVRAAEKAASADKPASKKSAPKKKPVAPAGGGWRRF